MLLESCKLTHSKFSYHFQTPVSVSALFKSVSTSSTSMSSYFSKSPSSKKKKSLSIQEIELLEDRNRRRSRIEQCLTSEAEARKEGEANGVVGDYFKWRKRVETPCINKKCCKRCSYCCCFFCRDKQRCCLLLIFMFFCLLILFFLTSAGILPYPTDYIHH